VLSHLDCKVAAVHSRERRPRKVARRWGVPWWTAVMLIGIGLAGCGSSASSTTTAPASHHTNTGGTQASTSAWHTSSVSTSGSGEFDRAVCPAAADCWAVANLDVGGKSSAQIFHLSAGQWTQATTPSATSLYGIACPSTTDCWAVGALVPSGSQNAATLIEHYDGQSWQAVSSPNAPNFPESGLSGVGCSSSQSCWAVGEGDDPSQDPTTGHLLLLHYDGKAWSIASAPSQQQEQQSDNGAYVECPSMQQCMLLYNYGTSGGQSNAEEGAIYDGRTWRSLQVPDGILIQGASCPGVNNCYAIGGTSFNNPGTTESLYHFDGSNWTPGPELTSTAGVSWSALACVPGTSDCWAGGGGPVTEGDTTPVVLSRLVGGNWVDANPPQVVGDLQDIFCASTSSCVAVGDAMSNSGSSTSGSNNGTPLVLRLGS